MYLNAVGIDLGTTNSSLSLVKADGGKAVLLRIGNCRTVNFPCFESVESLLVPCLATLMPSSVHFYSDDNEVAIGYEAKLEFDSDRTINRTSISPCII